MLDNKSIRMPMNIARKKVKFSTRMSKLKIFIKYIQVQTFQEFLPYCHIRLFIAESKNISVKVKV